MGVREERGRGDPTKREERGGKRSEESRSHDVTKRPR